MSLNLHEQVMTIQLFNHETVPCQWSIAEEEKLDKKVGCFYYHVTQGY